MSGSGSGSGGRTSTLMDEGGGGDGYSPAAIVLTPPSPMGADGASRAHIIALLQQSQTRWLKNTEVCDILLNHRAYDFVLSPNAPIQPSGARRRFFPPRRRQISARA